MRTSSVNPRLLLALLEYRSGWLTNKTPNADQQAYPLGYRNAGYQGLYLQLGRTANRLNDGYYGWKSRGARTVRGYRENQFHGRRVAYARNELRLGRSARDGFYAFVDGSARHGSAPPADLRKRAHQRMRRIDFVVPVCADEEEGAILESGHQQGDELQGGRVEPLHRLLAPPRQQSCADGTVLRLSHRTAFWCDAPDRCAGL